MLKLNDKIFLIGVSVDTLSRHVRQGTLKGQRIGQYRMVLVELSELERWRKEVYNAAKAQVIKRYWTKRKRKRTKS
jgi:hypothetical protein